MKSFQTIQLGSDRVSGTLTAELAEDGKNIGKKM